MPRYEPEARHALHSPHRQGHSGSIPVRAICREPGNGAPLNIGGETAG